MVESGEGGFAVEMPGPPEEFVGVLDGPAGPAHTRSHMFASGRWNPSWNALYIVDVRSIQGSDTNLERHRLLPTERDRVVANASLTLTAQEEAILLSETEIALGAFPGLALTIKQPYGRRSRARIYLVDERLYTLYAVDEEPRMKRFFESFRLEGTVSAAEQSVAADETRLLERP